MIDKNKQYRTRSGLPVEIYATDRGGEYPVHGAALEGGIWCPLSWTSEGKHAKAQKSIFDLIEVKPRINRTLWVNVYDDFCHCHTSRQDADHRAVLDRRACIEIKIDCEEGEGL